MATTGGLSSTFCWIRMVAGASSAAGNLPFTAKEDASVTLLLHDGRMEPLAGWLAGWLVSWRVKTKQ